MRCRVELRLQRATGYILSTIFNTHNILLWKQFFNMTPVIHSVIILVKWFFSVNSIILWTSPFISSPFFIPLPNVSQYSTSFITVIPCSGFQYDFLLYNAFQSVTHNVLLLMNYTEAIGVNWGCLGQPGMYMVTLFFNLWLSARTELFSLTVTFLLAWISSFLSFLSWNPF